MGTGVLQLSCDEILQKISATEGAPETLSCIIQRVHNYATPHNLILPNQPYINAILPMTMRRDVFNHRLCLVYFYLRIWVCEVISERKRQSSVSDDLNPNA